MAPRLTALGWQVPLPQAVTAWLVGEDPTLDFSGWILTVPGARAGRRVISLLAEAAYARHVSLVPPKVCTPGTLLGELLKVPGRIAGDLARQVAWAKALVAMDEAERELLFPKPPSDNDLGGWLKVAVWLAEAGQELASGCLTFGEVARRAEKDGRLGDAQRWAVAAKVEVLYLQELTRVGLVDEQHARRTAMAAGAMREPTRLVLAGVVQLSGQTQEVLVSLARKGLRIDELTYVPSMGYENLAKKSMKFGHCPEIPENLISAADVRFAEGPAEVAREIFRALGSLRTPPAADEVTIGILDETLVGFVEAEAANLPGVKVRYGAGGKVTGSGPYMLLAACATFLETGRFREFVGLVRVPEVREWLEGEWGKRHKGTEAQRHKGGAEDLGVETSYVPVSMPEWLGVLDEYGGRYLPDVMGERCAREEGWLCAGEFGETDVRGALAWLYAEICILLGTEGEGMRNAKCEVRKDDGEGTLAEAGERMLGILGRGYGGREWDKGVAAERAVVQACYVLREGINELLADGETRLGLAEAVRVLLRLVAGKRLTDESGGDEVEMVGWMELMADDAEHLVVAGMNEGVVPEGTRPGPFLNDSVRRVLGLADDAERVARDRYLLACMLGSRGDGARRERGGDAEGAENTGLATDRDRQTRTETTAEGRRRGSVTLIAGRVSAAGDPLLPSRLLFGGEAVEQAKRVQAFVERGPRTAVRGLLRAVRPGGVSGFLGVVIPEKGKISVPESLRVTAFRDYLRSPAGFYLQHIHGGGLETVAEESPRELAVMDFGTLVHAVVKDALGADANVDSAAGWEERLLAALQARVELVYGRQRTATLEFQVALLEKRLAKLAEWQHAWRGAGWRTRWAEWSPQEKPALMVDGLPMGLRGRIDRIDYNEGLGAWAVLDYKICGGDKTPEKAHQARGGWVDLQLPLYLVLAAEVLRAGGEVKLGYVRVADKPEFIGEKLAEWGEEELRSADEAAGEVVRKIRAKEFTEEGEEPPTEGVFGNIFGEGVGVEEEE